MSPITVLRSLFSFALNATVYFLLVLTAIAGLGFMVFSLEGKKSVSESLMSMAIGLTFILIPFILVRIIKRIARAEAQTERLFRAMKVLSENERGLTFTNGIQEKTFNATETEEDIAAIELAQQKLRNLTSLLKRNTKEIESKRAGSIPKKK
jgi:hypothetical protein